MAGMEYMEQYQTHQTYGNNIYSIPAITMIPLSYTSSHQPPLVLIKEHVLPVYVILFIMIYNGKQFLHQHSYSKYGDTGHVHCETTIIHQTPTRTRHQLKRDHAPVAPFSEGS